ncbi:MAG: AraC family transcriptional regulator [Deltaproteobacteria bacterium]|nr:AraC family transcriptional regulator [Deltaproteobacteria bacterium]MBW2389351.1 AraC family transcriptional regulator [Deltaproteobacteria bacterium]MBW2724402.1 AraC family transcriptional regulator [Deltaproteobacteria bacterium]
MRSGTPDQLTASSSALASVPSSWILHFGALLDEKGFPFEPVFRQCGIDPDLSAEDEDGVSLVQFASLVANGLRITGDSGLGLEYGRSGRISHFGILGYALLSARDLRQAIEFVSRYYENFDPVISFEFEIAGQYVCAKAVESIELGRFEIFAHEATLACTAAIARVLLDQPIRPTRLTLCYPEPPHSLRYEAVFDCRPEFDAAHTCIEFERVHLDAPLKLSNQETAELCRAQCERWLHATKERGDLVAMVRQELLKTPGRFPKLDAVAAALGLSVRSLRRHLSEKSVSYQELLDEVRRNLAVDYLSNSLLSVEQIAELVGYGEAANFRKAFRKWTGKAPSEFRK